jgi:hypothetical protein
MSQAFHAPLFSRNPHRDDARHQKMLEEVFSCYLPNWGRSSAATHVSPLANIPKPTSDKWKAKWEADRLWRPWNPEVHGQHHRTFTEEQEQEIAEEAITEYILPGRLFNVHDIYTRL